MLNIYPWGLSLNIVEPLGLSACRVRFRRFLHEEHSQEGSMDLDEVQQEDEAVVLSVQRGMGSMLYRDGRFSPQHERAVHHFHRQLADCSRS
jgi:choline monooxygenase